MPLSASAAARSGRARDSSQSISWVANQSAFWRSRGWVGFRTAERTVRRTWSSGHTANLVGDNPSVLTELAVALEAELFEGRQITVVQKSCGNSARRFGVPLNGAAAEVRDQVKSPGQGCGRYALSSMAFADVAAADTPSRQRGPSSVVSDSVLDPRNFLRRPELSPAKAVVTIEDECGVCGTRSHALELALPVPPIVARLTTRMHAHAPASAEDAAVRLDEFGERIPCRLIKRADCVVSDS